MALATSGQIVLFRFPQTDLNLGKLRPALLIAPSPSVYDDWLVCMISTQSHQTISGIDDLISVSDPDFPTSGLKADSVFRLTRLAVVSSTIFSGTTGMISSQRLKSLKSKIAKWIETS